MKIIVVGSGRFGVELVKRLYKRGNNLSVIDSVPAAFNNLPPDFTGRTIEGDALNKDVLFRAGIEEADGLAAVTNQDALNAVVAHIARAVYHVPNIVVRNYDPHSKQLLELLELQIISSTSWGAQRVEEALYQESVRTIYSSGDGEVTVYEFTIPDWLDGKVLSALLIPGETLPVSLDRNRRAVIPSPDMQARSGDKVYISATQAGYNAFLEKMKALKEA